MSSSHDQANYDETRVPEYTLPDLMVMADGTAVTDAAGWYERRAELIDLLARHEYGDPIRPPDRLTIARSESWERDALRFTQVEVVAFQEGRSLPFHLLAVRPADCGSNRLPFIAALNFFGNHSVSDDSRIWLPVGWVPDRHGARENKATPASRGVLASRWPFTLAAESGFGVVTAYCGDFDPDFHDGFRNGVHGLYPDSRSSANPTGTIGAWAWGLSRILDVASDHEGEELGARNDAVAALGHSRLGKTALWAAATDERFAAAISNESGCGGAALARRAYGETIGAITSTFPHWFAPAYAEYAERDTELPVDQHMLLATIAPRPLSVGSAEDDVWADPRGEFLSAVAAGPAYELLGTRAGLPAEWPAVGSEIGGRLHYHCREGDHELTERDWQIYLDFLRRELGAS